MADVSVVILNWNGLGLLPGCLESLRRCGDPLELIVVDNGSTDGSLEYLRSQRDVVLIANATNTGYASGNNAGIARAQSEFILLLKLGQVDAAYFQDKFGVDILARFAKPLAHHAAAGHMVLGDGRVTLTRQGLLRVDELLHEFFRLEHRGPRYT